MLVKFARMTMKRLKLYPLDARRDRLWVRLLLHHNPPRSTAPGVSSSLATDLQHPLGERRPQQVPEHVCQADQADAVHLIRDCYGDDYRLPTKK